VHIIGSFIKDKPIIYINLWNKHDKNKH